MKFSSSRSYPQDGGGEAEQPRKRSIWPIAIILIVLLLVGSLFAASNLDSMTQSVRKGVSDLFSLFFNFAQPNSRLNYTVYSPIIQNGSANVSYPPDYASLADYALGLINADRGAFGLSAVALSDNPVGQQHANSMLRFGYFSHFDTQGFKPYMRYTLLDGRGAVGENVAYISGSSTLKQGLSTLEHDMMYNDVACCNNGHRINILNNLHNYVSIGIAYNSTTLFFVEDFENDYANLTFKVSSSYSVTMTGSPIPSSPIANLAYVTYDPTPTAETRSQLNGGPHEYTPGTLVGGVLPPCGILSCTSFASGITVHADTWRFSSTTVDIAFSLHDFIQAKGAGVYTVYLITGSDTNSAITSISVFVSG